MESLHTTIEDSGHNRENHLLAVDLAHDPANQLIGCESKHVVIHLPVERSHQARLCSPNTKETV